MWIYRVYVFKKTGGARVLRGARINTDYGVQRVEVEPTPGHSHKMTSPVTPVALIISLHGTNCGLMVG